jgi:hypothetical protein
VLLAQPIGHVGQRQTGGPQPLRINLDDDLTNVAPLDHNVRADTIMRPIEQDVARTERLYNAGQSDLVKLPQVRHRWIESANTRLDAT